MCMYCYLPPLAVATLPYKLSWNFYLRALIFIVFSFLTAYKVTQCTVEGVGECKENNKLAHILWKKFIWDIFWCAPLGKLIILWLRWQRTRTHYTHLSEGITRQVLLVLCRLSTQFCLWVICAAVYVCVCMSVYFSHLTA